MEQATLSTMDHVREDDSGISLESLKSELNETETVSDSKAAISKAISEAETALLGNESISYEAKHIKKTLDELLLSLISLRSANTHGQQLLDDLGREFDTLLSPGTVYPPLHELCEKGRLEQHELVRTKEYVFDDADAAQADIADAACQHFAFGMVFQAALEYGEFDGTQDQSATAQ